LFHINGSFFLLKSSNFNSTQGIYIVGSHLTAGDGEEGNVFTVPSNKFSEFNFFLDPRAAKAVVESGLDITLIPLRAQRQVASFEKVVRSLHAAEKTPESSFVYQLLLSMQKLQKNNQAYHHIVSFFSTCLISKLS
jgi:inosine-uridine nucleoside N-ribohydrolase